MEINSNGCFPGSFYFVFYFFLVLKPRKQKKHDRPSSSNSIIVVMLRYMLRWPPPRNWSYGAPINGRTKMDNWGSDHYNSTYKPTYCFPLWIRQRPHVSLLAASHFPWLKLLALRDFFLKAVFICQVEEDTKLEETSWQLIDFTHPNFKDFPVHLATTLICCNSGMLFTF